MAQVTVQQLAEVVGASVDRLLMQMKEAGLPHSAAEEAVSDEDKQTLLAFLKRSHGESEAAPKRITLKRKTISTLRTAPWARIGGLPHSANSNRPGRSTEACWLPKIRRREA